MVQVVLICLLFSTSLHAAESREKIAFAYAAISPSMAGVWMAKEIGAFERHGLNAELVYISSGATAIQGLVGGSVQAALGASNAVVAATLKGAPMIAVGSNTSRPGMQLWVQPEIQRAEQLAGKTLAITRFGSTSDFVTRLILRKLNLEGKTELRQFGGVVEADLGFRSRQAEGRVSSQAPGPQAKMLVDAAELGIPFSMNLLAVSNDYLKRAPKSVEAIVSAYIEGIAALKTRKPQALKLLEKYMGARGGSAETHYEFVSKYLDATPRVDPAAVDTVLEMVGSKGAAKSALFDNTIIDKLAREGFIEKLYRGSKVMTEKQWRECLNELVRDYMRSPEMDFYFSIKMSKPRAAVMVKQQSLFVRHRRECWAHVSAACPIMGVKQRILEHEFEEVIRDDYSDYGHLHLIIRQGKSVGLEPDEILNAEPTPETRAALYAWSWMTNELPWIQSLTGMTITEWCNDDRLLGDLGGGQSTRMAKKWMEDMGFSWKEIPNMQAHSQADEKHSDMFLPFIAEHVSSAKEEPVIQAAKDSLAFNAMYRKGIASAQEKIRL